MLIYCINDEKIVPPPVYVHPKANPKTTMVNGMKYLDDILSKLDKRNTELVLEIFKNNLQTIITHTDKTSISNINEINIYEQ